MSRLHLTRNLRTLAFLVAIAAVLAGIGGLWWANQTGLPASWRAAIEHEIERKGAHVSIGTLRYMPFQGVVATDVRIYSDPFRLREISRLERVILGFDKARLARGSFQLNKIQLEDATLVMPVDPTNPSAGTLDINGAYGTIYLPGDRRIEVSKARGRIAGIDLTLDARIIGQQNTPPPPDDNALVKRRALMAKIIHELEQWHFDKEHPPALQISVEADVNDRTTFAAKIALQVKGMEKNGHVLDEVTGSADIAGDLVTITSLKATDERGEFEGHFDYDLAQRSGRFDVTSSIEVPQLMTAWAGFHAPRDAVFGGKQLLEAGGDFTLDENNIPLVRMTGHARCESVLLRGMPFEYVESAFSWADGNLFLRDLKLHRGDGEATAKAMIEWPLVRMQLHSTLPIPVYRPFFVGQPLGNVLNDMAEREHSSVDVNLEGGFDASNREAWAYTGSGTVRNLDYKGVPLNLAHCAFILNHHELDFNDGTVVFNYAKYPLRKAFGGPDEATAKVGRIRFDAREKLVEVENVSGEFWASPMVRMFAPKVADLLEIYRFHRPPKLTGTGVVDVTPEGRTNLTVTFASENEADYEFLEKNLTLGHPSATVRIHGPRVNVENLRLEAFDGPVTAHFETHDGKLDGELSWTKLSIPPLATTYDFQLKGGGTVTGRINFSMTGGKVATMDGSGLLALENTELFAVPMFGPMTNLIGDVLNKEEAGFQHAKNAFCTFNIENGILSTTDFHTSTRSLNFTGEGSVDMRDRTVDVTIRMNARGLLKLITVLRPFSGLFQFHGTGPLKSPEWNHMKFSPPTGRQNDILLAPPKARIVDDGN